MPQHHAHIESNRNEISPYKFDPTSVSGTNDKEVINLELDDDSINSNLSSALILEADTNTIKNTSVDKWFLNQHYYLSNPMLNETHCKIFNENFVSFFDFFYRKMF